MAEEVALTNPVDRDLAIRMREMRRKLAREAQKPRPAVEVEDLLPTEAAQRLGPPEG